MKGAVMNPKEELIALDKIIGRARVVAYRDRWGAMRKLLSCLVITSVVLVSGCEDEGEGSDVNQATADKAFAKGKSVVWVESKSDFWDVRSVRISGSQLGSNAGTYELAPGSYSLSVTCRNDPWKDQWAREHESEDYTESVGITAVAGQVVHVIVDSTGEGERFSLSVAQ